MTHAQNMNSRFSELEVRLDTLIELLGDADEHHWRDLMRRAVGLVRQHDLAGASLVLDACRGDESFRTLELAKPLQARNPARYLILNHKLEHLRASIFVVAAELASATSHSR